MRFVKAGKAFFNNLLDQRTQYLGISIIDIPVFVHKKLGMNLQNGSNQNIASSKALKHNTSEPLLCFTS